MKLYEASINTRDSSYRRSVGQYFSNKLLFSFIYQQKGIDSPTLT